MKVENEWVWEKDKGLRVIQTVVVWRDLFHHVNVVEFRVHHIISSSSSSDTTDDDKPLTTWVGGGNKFPVGTRLRKKFGNNRFFNGRVVSFDRTEKQWP